VLEIPRGEVDPQLDGDTILICEAAGDGFADRAWYFPGLPREMRLPPAKLRVGLEGDAASGLLAISTDVYARVVTLDADLDFSDNYFDLLAGEERLIQYSNPAAKAGMPEIEVSCWNAANGLSEQIRLL